MRLIFLRHGKAGDHGDEAQRALTRVGAEASAQRLDVMAPYFLREKSMEIWCSDYARSKETATFFACELDVPIKVQKFLRKQKLSALVKNVGKSTKNTLLMVGHNPMLEDWLEEVTGLEKDVQLLDAYCLCLGEDDTRLLWYWPEGQDMEVFPYEKKMDEKEWLEACAMALHASWFQSFHGSSYDLIQEVKSMELLFAFLNSLKDELSQKHYNQALDRYQTAFNRVWKLSSLKFLLEDLSTEMELSNLKEALSDALKELEKDLEKERFSYEYDKVTQKAYKSLSKALRHKKGDSYWLDLLKGRMERLESQFLEKSKYLNLEDAKEVKKVYSIYRELLAVHTLMDKFSESRSKEVSFFMKEMDLAKLYFFQDLCPSVRDLLGNEKLEDEIQAYEASLQQRIQERIAMEKVDGN